MNSALDANGVRGSTLPRLWTPPLRELTPDTSYGYDVITFADEVLGQPLDEWQQWLVIHMGELLDDGRPRFRTVLILIARQNGKSTLSRVLTLYWMFVERQPLTLSTSTTLSYAKESWRWCCDVAKSNQWLACDLPDRGAVRAAIGEEELRTRSGARYKIAAANRAAGRGLTISRLVLDELREHSSWDCWSASTYATNAVPDAQIIALSNMGDDNSIVLDALRTSAVQYLETGAGDPRLGIFEWSAPAGADVCDLQALAMANPSLGYRMDPDALLGAALRAKRAGGLELAQFRTEVLCQRVHHLDSALDPDQWTAAGTDTPIDLAQHRDRVCLGLDVSLDASHCTLAAAAIIDNVLHVEILAGWNSTREMREQLPGIVARVRPRSLGWLPGGPAAAVMPDLMERRRAGWPPRKVALEELRSEVPAVCMSFAERLASGQLQHGRDPLLDAHVANAQRLHRGDGWVYQRRSSGPVDALYAASIAAFVARTLPPPRPPLRAVRAARG